MDIQEVEEQKKTPTEELDIYVFVTLVRDRGRQVRRQQAPIHRHVVVVQPPQVTLRQYNDRSRSHPPLRWLFFFYYLCLLIFYSSTAELRLLYVSFDFTRIHFVFEIHV